MKLLLTITAILLFNSVRGASIHKVDLGIGFKQKKTMFLRIEFKPQKPILFSIVPKSLKRGEKDFHDSPLLGFRSQLDERIWWSQLSLNFISGTARGVKDLSAFRYYKLKERFPKLNDNFCDANKSYLNKYAARNPDNGAKFFGSTTAFVATTDLWHLSQFINHTCLYVSMIIPLYPSYDRRLNWKEIAGRYATIIGANAIGYHFAYDKQFRF